MCSDSGQRALKQFLRAERCATLDSELLVSPGPGNVDVVGNTEMQKEKKEMLAPIGEEGQESPGDDHRIGRRRQSPDQRRHGAAHGDVEPPMGKGNVEKMVRMA